MSQPALVETINSSRWAAKSFVRIVLLRRAEGRAVVVGKVEMGDAAVEGPADDGAPGLESIRAAEILPEPKGDGRQL